MGLYQFLHMVYTQTCMAKHSKELAYSKAQRVTLVVCAFVMGIYILLAYLFTEGSFWTFATVHVVLLVATGMFSLVRRVPKPLTYVAVFVGLVGAGTALALVLFYLIILANLAAG